MGNEKGHFNQLSTPFVRNRFASKLRKLNKTHLEAVTNHEAATSSMDSADNSAFSNDDAYLNEEAFEEEKVQQQEPIKKSFESLVGDAQARHDAQVNSGIQQGKESKVHDASEIEM